MDRGSTRNASTLATPVALATKLPRYGYICRPDVATETTSIPHRTGSPNHRLGETSWGPKTGRWSNVDERPGSGRKRPLPSDVHPAGAEAAIVHTKIALNLAARRSLKRSLARGEPEGPSSTTEPVMERNP